MEEPEGCHQQQWEGRRRVPQKVGWEIRGEPRKNSPGCHMCYFCGCWTKLPQAWRLKTSWIYYGTVLEVRSLKCLGGLESRCGQGCGPYGLPGEARLPGLFYFTFMACGPSSILKASNLVSCNNHIHRFWGLGWCHLWGATNWPITSWKYSVSVKFMDKIEWKSEKCSWMRTEKYTLLGQEHGFPANQTILVSNLCVHSNS